MLTKDEEIEEMRKQIIELSVMCMVLEKVTPRRREITEKKETDCKYINTRALTPAQMSIVAWFM